MMAAAAKVAGDEIVVQEGVQINNTSTLAPWILVLYSVPPSQTRRLNPT